MAMKSAEADVKARARQRYCAALLALLPSAAALAHEPGQHHGAIPVWLPPLPFAIIACTLFVLAILAALSGRGR
jgi:hypothetical protein